MTKGQAKLFRHRENALNGTRKTPPVKPSEYAKTVGLPPQRIASLLKPGAQPPTVPEAVGLWDALKINPRDWVTQTQSA